MKKILFAVILSNIGLAQTTQQPLMVTRIFNIGSAWAGECAAGSVNNVSLVSRRNDYHATNVTSASGSWSVSINFSDTACTGPWTSFGANSTVNQASSTKIAAGFGYHPYIQIAITGNAVVTYSASRNFSIAASGGGGGGNGTVIQVNCSAPLTGCGFTTSGTIAIPRATVGVDGYLSALDFTTFNTKVTSVFGRSPVVVATTGDYTAAQVTNAVDTTQTYNNPAWITALAASKVGNGTAQWNANQINSTALGGLTGVSAWNAGIPGVIAGNATDCIKVNQSSGPCGGGGGGNMALTINAGAPSGACSPGVQWALDSSTTPANVWFCSISGTWELVLATLNSGLYVSTGLAGATPATPASGYVKEYYDITAKTAQTVDDAGNKATMVRANPCVGQVVQSISATGAITCGAGGGGGGGGGPVSTYIPMPTAECYQGVARASDFLQDRTATAFCSTNTAQLPNYVYFQDELASYAVFQPGALFGWDGASQVDFTIDWVSQDNNPALVVNWQIQGGCKTSALNIVFNTAQNFFTNVTSTLNGNIHTTMANVNLAGCSSTDIILIKITRTTGDSSTAFASIVTGTLKYTSVTGASGSGGVCTDFPAVGVLPSMNVAGHVYCLNGAYTFSAASTISSNNVTIILGGPGTTITRSSGTTDLFDITGLNDRLYCNGGILDGGSLNGGPLFNVNGGTLARISDCQVQNFGTSNAAVFSNFADQLEIDRLTCLNASFTCIKLTSVNSSTTVTNFKITNGKFTSSGASAPNTLLEVDQVSASPLVRQGLISGNYFTGRDGAGNAALVTLLGPSSAGGGITSVIFSENVCYVLATLHACWKLFGVDHSTISHNIVYDNGQVLSNGAFYLGDLYHSTVIGNVAYQTSGGIGINLIDGEGNSITGNAIHGFNNGGSGQVAGIYLVTTAGNCSNNVIAGNMVQFQSIAGDGIKIHSNTNGFACSFNTVASNHILGTGTASQLGITLALANSGTGVNNLIGTNQITNVPTGITNGATTTSVSAQGWDTVTTKWSFSVATLVTDYTGVVFASIPANLANGSMLFVSDSTIANPCASGGNGAILKRLNGVSVCN